MWRFLHLLAIGAVVASAAYVYTVKYQTIYAAEQIVKTQHLIAKEKDAINVLRAEYAHLTRPERLQALADKELQMQPLALNQIVKADELPMPHQNIDSSGDKLQSLGLGDNATPSGARIGQLALILGLAYLGIGGKLIKLGVSSEPPPTLKAAADQAVSGARPDLLDRNGEILATDVKTMSVFAEPKRILDKDEAVELITAVLPDVNAKELRERLFSKKGFVWIKRQVTPKEQEEIFHLGLPGLGFLPENKRVYPNGPIGAHVLGYVDKDNIGIAGMEKYLDEHSLTDPHVAGFNVDPEALKPVRLSLDLKATHALRDELQAGLERFRAKAGAGAILDVNTGEIIALESLPDYDPNEPGDMRDLSKINRINVGVYEMGSTFKAISIAMALESGKVNLGSHVDARESLRYGRFTIHDFHATHRVLSVPEVFTHSSNIGTARMALMVGVEGHKAFLKKMGQLDRLRTELPESAEPLWPKHWSELNTMTIAFGQGLNVAPLQALMAVGALVNGGHLMKPTFLMRDEKTAMAGSERVVSDQTSESMRYLMRSNATHGSATFANIEGYYVGGKTGTADKIIGRHYSSDQISLSRSL